MAIETVMERTCLTLFDVRRMVVEDPEADGRSVSSAKEALKELMNWLRWTRWKECAACGFDEVCFLPMWPFGDRASHEQPNCRNATSLQTGWWHRDTQYWGWMPAPMVMAQSSQDYEFGDL
jgi:hypothetical protein